MLEANHSDSSNSSEFIRCAKTFQKQISSLSATLFSSNSNVADLDFQYPPSDIRTFIRNASQAQLTGVLVDVIIALSDKNNTHNAEANQS